LVFGNATCGFDSHHVQGWLFWQARQEQPSPGVQVMGRRGSSC
jgi:hypothetical protein